MSLSVPNLRFSQPPPPLFFFCCTLFPGYPAQFGKKNKAQNLFEIFTEERTLLLKASSLMVVGAWMEEIDQAIEDLKTLVRCLPWSCVWLVTGLVPACVPACVRALALLLLLSFVLAQLRESISVCAGTISSKISRCCRGGAGLSGKPLKGPNLTDALPRAFDHTLPRAPPHRPGRRRGCR